MWPGEVLWAVSCLERGCPFLICTKAPNEITFSLHTDTCLYGVYQDKPSFPYQYWGGCFYLIYEEIVAYNLMRIRKIQTLL